MLVRLREEVQEVSRPLAAVLILGAVVSCARGSNDIGGPSTSVPTISPIAAASVAASAGPGILDDRFGYVVGERELKVRSETSDAAITSFVPQGRSWTSLSRTVAPDGGAIAYWAPVNDGAVLHVRSAATGADRAVFTAASDMSGNTFAWSSDGTGLVIAIDNNCQEICAVQGGTPKQELWTVDLPTGATEKIATGRYWLPVAWDRTAKLIAAGLTGPGGYLIGYDIIDTRLKPYVSKVTGYEPALLGQLRASSDARYVLLRAYGATADTLSWWPLAEPQKRQDVPFDGSGAEWRPGTSEIWWLAGLTPAGCRVPPCVGTELVALDVVTGARRSIRGTFGGSLVGFRVDGSAAMTWQRVAPESLIVVDVASTRTATLPVGGWFVRLR